MITKCPHCNTKFKVRDEYKGRKTKCSKCEQSFTIGEFIAKPAPSNRETNGDKKKVKVCAKCGKRIGKLEKSYPFKGVVICEGCQQKPSVHSGCSQIERLQKACRYIELLKGVRMESVLGLILGMMALFVGVSYFEKAPITGIVAVVLGLFFLVEGMVFLVSPKPQSVIIHGLAFLLLGLSFIGFCVFKMRGGERADWALIGIAPVAWGCQMIASFKKYAGLASVRSDRQLLVEVREIINEFRRADATEREDMITFKAGRFYWKGQLKPSYGIFAREFSSNILFLPAEILLLPKDEVDLEKVCELAGERIEVRARLGEQTYNAIIFLEDMEQFQAWKNMQH